MIYIAHQSLQGVKVLIWIICYTLLCACESNASEIRLSEFSSWRPFAFPQQKSAIFRLKRQYFTEISPSGVVFFGDKKSAKFR